MPSQHVVTLRELSFAHDGAEQPLFSQLTASLPTGFTGIIGANGAGKSTLLRLLVGELTPSGGTIDGATHAVYCPQRVDDPPPSLAVFLEDWDASVFELRIRLGIEPDFLARWQTLSHGERKRTQIAHALWQSPSLLAIDEPTNHIDAKARRLLLDNLKRFTGIGVIVSHDRALLDELCAQCLWLDPPKAQMHNGGITAAHAARGEQQEAALRERHEAKQASLRLHREMTARRAVAAGEHKRRSKRGLARGDSDAREKINRARVTDGNAGSTLRQLTGRTARAQARLDAARVRKEYDTGIWLDGSRSSRDTVLQLLPGKLALGEQRCLQWPALSIKPEDRIALTGMNGTGKSSWLEYVVPRLNVPGEHVVLLPQEVSATAAAGLLATVKALPSAQLGQIMTIVRRLNSSPQRLLESDQPSPGEVRKLLLALGISRHPNIIVMDEPTNHLDLPSIKALEAALTACPCALLLVSHDERFIDAVSAQRWQLRPEEGGRVVLDV
jgi:ATPase subunit of ABC transporter with duplicated ATPase domains